MASCIKMIQGSSISPAVINQVQALAANYSCVPVCLNSNHTYDHVSAESEAYAPLALMGSYCLASRDTFYGPCVPWLEQAKARWTPVTASTFGGVPGRVQALPLLPEL